MDFKNLIGNDEKKFLLKKFVETNNLVNSYMFVGQSGIGKKLFAIEFIKKILNIKDNYDYNNNVNFTYIEPEGKSIKIEKIRSLQEKIYEKPIDAIKKVYLINDADLMTEQAQNCLLKTLEEPPNYIIIILIVSNESKLLATIKSRCVKVDFKKLKDEEIKQYLSGIGVKDVTSNFLRFCDGSIGNANIISEKQNMLLEIEKIFINMNKLDIVDVLNSSEVLYKNKEEIFYILEYINIVLLDLSKGENFNYLNCISIVEKTKERLIANSNYDMSIDNLLFEVWEEVNETYSRC